MPSRKKEPKVFRSEEFLFWGKFGEYTLDFTYRKGRPKKLIDVERTANNKRKVRKFTVDEYLDIDISFEAEGMRFESALDFTFHENDKFSVEELCDTLDEFDLTELAALIREEEAEEPVITQWVKENVPAALLDNSTEAEAKDSPMYTPRSFAKDEDFILDKDNKTPDYHEIEEEVAAKREERFS